MLYCYYSVALVTQNRKRDNMDKKEPVDTILLYNLYKYAIEYGDPQSIVDMYKQEYEEATGFTIDEKGNITRPENKVLTEDKPKTLNLFKKDKSSH